MKSLICLASTVLLLLCQTSFVYAQGFDDNDPENVPIDGGASALVLAATVYGAKKIRDKQKAGNK